MGLMDDAKKAAENAGHKAKEAWEDATDGNDEKADNSQPAADTRRADAEGGNPEHHHEMGEQLRRDP